MDEMGERSRRLSGLVDVVGWESAWLSYRSRKSIWVLGRGGCLLSAWREGSGRLREGSIVLLVEDLAGLRMAVSIVFAEREWSRSRKSILLPTL
jgi:hypothetical protein